jgi:hypothetical protein
MISTLRFVIVTIVVESAERFEHSPSQGRATFAVTKRWTAGSRSSSVSALRGPGVVSKTPAI